MAAAPWLVQLSVDLLSLFLVYLPWIILNSGAVEPYHRGFYCNDETLKYPYKDSTIPSSVLVAVSVLLPALVVLITEGVHTYVDKYNGIVSRHHPLGRWSIRPYVVVCYRYIGIFLFGAATQQTITNICKYSIGRLRPHFLDICQPNFTTFDCFDDQGFYRFIEEDVCLNADEHRLKEMRLSFPSGHASLSCYAMTFTVLYLEVRLTWKGSKLLRPFLQAIALYLAMLCCLSRISDYKHHWSDVLLGALLGILAALVVGVYVTSFFKGPTTRDVMNQMKLLFAGSQIDQREVETIPIHTRNEDGMYTIYS